MSSGPKPVPISAIEGWLTRGKADGALFVVVKTDTFDYDTYPIYVFEGQDVRSVAERVEDDFTKTMKFMTSVCLSNPSWPNIAPITLAPSIDHRKASPMSNVATICGDCSYEWVVVPAVARSYFCPRCGGDWGGQAADTLCVCGHRYRDHQTKLVRSSAAPPKRQAPIGTCLRCICTDYHLRIPHLTADDCLRRVQHRVNRGAAGRDVKVNFSNESATRFSLGDRSVLASALDTETIRIARSDVPVSEGSSFTMGKASVSDIVRSIISALMEHLRCKH
jgi:hypothetical protein